jgi:hypothetical protein
MTELTQEQKDTIRAANRVRKQLQRSRDRARSDRATLAYFERLRAEKVYAEDIARRTARGMCTFGEVAPGVNASTVEEALEVAREMARAIGADDVSEGESLLDFETRIFNEWINFAEFIGHHSATVGGGGGPYLNRETGQLFPGFGKAFWIDHGGFDKNWTPLPGAKEKIDRATLPKLKDVKKVEEAKPKPSAPPRPFLPTPVPQQPPNAVHFGWIPPGAYRHLHGV